MAITLLSQYTPQFWTFRIIITLWVIWLLYWLASWTYEYFKGKRTAVVKGKRSWLQTLLLGIALYTALVPLGSKAFPLNLSFLPQSVILEVIGILITSLGLSLAIWARSQLSTNWSSIPALRKDQTLTTTGPYSIVRHPIYSGMLFAIIGSVIAINQYVGFIAIVCITLFAWIRIKKEEKLMTEQFGKSYKNYKKKVKMIIPGIL